MKVFVTGSSSSLAQALLPRLCERPDVERVTGVDLKPPRFIHTKFDALALDIRDPQLAQRMAGHNYLINMSFVVLRGHMPEAEMFDTNVKGNLAVFHAARGAGMQRLIHLSSAAVYGSGVHLSEHVAPAPLPQFLYAQHKAHLEKLLAIEYPECVRLRPHIILGSHAQPLLKQLLNQPCYVRLPSPHPRLQCVHEDDVVRAIMLCLERDVRGPFNLAVEDSFSFREAIKSRNRVNLPLPLPVARFGLNLAWKYTGWGGEPAWLDGLTKTLLINCRRAHTELGWRSRYSAMEVLAQT